MVLEKEVYFERLKNFSEDQFLSGNNFAKKLTLYTQRQYLTMNSISLIKTILTIQKLKKIYTFTLRKIFH